MFHTLPTTVTAHILQWCSILDWVRYLETCKSAQYVMDYLRLHATHVYIESHLHEELYFFLSGAKRHRQAQVQAKRLRLTSTTDATALHVAPVAQVHLSRRVSESVEYRRSQTALWNLFMDRHYETLQHGRFTCRQVNLLEHCPHLTRVRVDCVCAKRCLNDRRRIDPSVLVQMEDAYQELCARPHLQRLDIEYCGGNRVSRLFGAATSRRLTHLTLRTIPEDNATFFAQCSRAFHEHKLEHLELHLEINTAMDRTRLITFIDHHAATLVTIRLYIVSATRGDSRINLSFGTTMPRLHHLKVHHPNRSNGKKMMTVEFKSAPRLEVLELTNVLLDMTECDKRLPALREWHTHLRQFQSMDVNVIVPQLQRLIIDCSAYSDRHHYRSVEHLSKWLLSESNQKMTLKLNLLIMTGMTMEGLISPWVIALHNRFVDSKRLVLRKGHHGLTRHEQDTFGLQEDSDIMLMVTYTDPATAIINVCTSSSSSKRCTQFRQQFQCYGMIGVYMFVCLWVCWSILEMNVSQL